MIISKQFWTSSSLIKYRFIWTYFEVAVIILIILGVIHFKVAINFFDLLVGKPIALILTLRVSRSRLI